MIDIYDYRDLNTKIATLPVLTATVDQTINASYNLNATCRPKTLKELNIILTPFTVYKVDGVFYRSLSFASSDSETGKVTIDATDLLFADLTEMDVVNFTFTNNAFEMLKTLFQNTKFKISNCDNTTTLPIDLTNTNKLVVLNKILEIFDLEMERNLLDVSFKNKIEILTNGLPIKLVKGKNIISIDENVDTSTVITKLRYADTTSDPPIIKTITSPYVNDYPVKEGYKEFKTNADQQAQEYLKSVELPVVTYKISTPFQLRYNFKLGTVVNLLCEQIGINLTIRVISYTKDLTNQSATTYTLGHKLKSFTEMAADLFIKNQDAQTDINFDELFDDKMALVIPDIVNEVYDQLEFPPLPDYLVEDTLDTKITNIATDIVDQKLLDFDGGGNNGGGSNGDSGHIILDHLPTQSEIDDMPIGSVVLVYDSSKPYVA